VDGFGSFHTKCDNQGATVVVLRSNTGHLFGGYTSVGWASRGGYVTDNNAFIFTLTNPHGIPPTKYGINSINCAISDVANFGPTFGGGHDIYVPQNSDVTNGYCGFPHTYLDTTGRGNNTLTGSRSLLLTEIEVFKCT
jgi:hypothetical protein